MDFVSDDLGGLGMLDVGGVAGLSQESNTEEDNWDMPVATGDLSDLSNATFSRVFSWHGSTDAPRADGPPGLGAGALDATGVLDSLTVGEGPVSSHSTDSRHGGLFVDPPFSSGSADSRPQGLPDPPRSTGSASSRSAFTIPADGGQGGEAPGRQGGIWEVDALTIPSMCDQSVRMRGEWGSNIMGGSWGRNLVLPGLAGLSGEPLDAGPSPPSTMRSSPFSFGSGALQGEGEVGMADELTKLRREREELEMKLSDFSRSPEDPPDPPAPQPPIPTFRRHKSHPPAKVQVPAGAGQRVGAQGGAEGASAASTASTADGGGAGGKPGTGVDSVPEDAEEGGDKKGTKAKGKGVGEDGWEAAKGRAARRRSSLDEKKAPRGSIGADANPFQVQGEEEEEEEEEEIASPRRRRSEGKGAGAKGEVLQRKSSADGAKNGSAGGRGLAGRADREREVSKQAGSPKAKSKEGGGKKEVAGKKGGHKDAKRAKREEVVVEEEAEEEAGDEQDRWTVAKVFWGLFQMDQSEILGACLFTLVYFGILYMLSGPTVRIAFISIIVLIQLSYQVQFPKFVWDPVSRGVDAVRQLWMGLWVGEAQIAAAMNRGGTRRRVRGDARRWKTPLGWRLVGWALLGALLWLVFYLFFNGDEEEQGQLLMSRLHMPVPPSSKHSQADAVCEEAQALEYKEEWVQVEQKLKYALQLEENNTCALYNYGRLLQYHWNKVDKAELMYWRALWANPRHVPTLRNLGYLLLMVRRDASDASKAEELFETALQENPKEMDVLSGYGSLLQDARNYHKAEHYLLRALKLRPSHMHSLHKYARILLYVKGDAVAAEKHLKGALEQAPHHLPVLVDYAQMLLSFWEQLGLSRRKGVDRAVEVLDRIVQINHNHLHGLHLLAVIEHFIRGRPAKADRFYRRVLEKNPKHLPTLPKYGMLLLQLGKVDQAEEMLKRMVEMEPKNTPIDGLIAYGHLLRVHRHNDQQAALMYKRALRMRPTKTVPMSPDESTRCWLCTNASSIKVPGLCCGTSSVVSTDMWWLEPALWRQDAAKIDFDQNFRADAAPRRA